jgi:ABC-type Fe3+ transport system permease subunit
MHKISPVIVVPAYGLICLLVGMMAGYVAPRDEPKHPTYHCDGSATMGYAVPGTPEAAACWIEGGEK